MALQHSSQPPRQTSPYMPDFDESDFAPPEWRLVQPTSQAHTQEDVPLGSYYCEQTGETARQLDIAILRVQRNRTYWISSDLNFPACTSDNRVMPRPGGRYKGPCATCEANGNGCYPGYNLLCVRLDQHGKPEPSEMFLLRVNGTSVFPFRKLWSRIHLNHQDNPWSIMVTLTSEMKTNEKGTYWVMAPNIAQEFTFEADLESLKALADGMTSQLEEGTQATQPPAIAETQRLADLKSLKTLANELADQQLSVSTPTPGRTPRITPVASETKPQPRLITEQEALEVIGLASHLGVPGEVITPFIQNTFGKDRLLQLHPGESVMLTRWLQQEFGQTRPQSQIPDNLPF